MLSHFNTMLVLDAKTDEEPVLATALVAYASATFAHGSITNKNGR